MAKKLTLEVDAETSKAKRKLQELAETGGAGGGSSNAVSQSADKAAKSLNNLGAAAKESNAYLKASVKVFAGMAVQMAAAQAAQSMPEGSAGRTAINAGGAAIAGAIQGSVAGPLGALAGATMGLASALMQASAEEKARRKAIEDSAVANREQLEAMEEADKRSDEFKKKLAELTSIKDLGERRAALDQAIKDSQNRYDTEIYGKLFQNSSAITAGKKSDEEFKKALAERAEWKNEMSQLKSAIGAVDALIAASRDKPAFRVSMSALDSLARIGGGAGRSDGWRDLQRTAEKQTAVLEKIEAKTGRSSKF